MANKRKRQPTSTPKLSGIIQKCDEPREKSGWVSVVAGVVILGIIYYRPEARLQQDVYQSQSDCQADWEQAELCREESASSSSGGRRWFGPSYYEDNREVETKSGKRIRPKQNRSSDKPVPVKGSVMDVMSRPIKRGGFSSTGSRGGG